MQYFRFIDIVHLFSTVSLPVEFMDQYSKDSTIHGVKYFSERSRHWIERFRIDYFNEVVKSFNHYFRLFWIAIFATSIILCTVNVADIYVKRKERPVMISIAKSLMATYEIPFPAITICPTFLKYDKE